MKKSFAGIVDQFGNLKIHNAKGMKNWLKDQPCTRLILSFEIEDEKGSVYQKAYFRNVICEAFKSAFIKHYGEHSNYDQITTRLLSWSPWGVSDEGEFRTLESLSKQELSAFIDHCKMIAAKEFDVDIYE
jgi:hypothetical protein